jgi:hypothetical protein
MIFAVWKWADYRNWQKYHATMIFLSFISLVYAFISFSSGVFLWRAKPDLFNSTVTEMMYSMILLPCTALLFLSGYPKDSLKKAVYFLKYIFIYGIVEAVMSATGRMVYGNGWTIWLSVIFDCLMFPAIIIHYKHPIIAYIVFILIMIFGIWFFKLPIT